MSWVSYLSVSELPARPDPHTGQPRPPRAPAYPGGEAHGRHPRRGSVPSPPPGQGPTLAWYRETRRGALVAAAWVLALMGGVFILAHGFDWMRMWPIWLVFALAALGVYASTRGTNCAAGADWLASYKVWVKTYDLVKVIYHGHLSGSELDLQDSEGRRLVINIDELSHDREMWDLVYNGLLHSVTPVVPRPTVSSICICRCLTPRLADGVSPARDTPVRPGQRLLRPRVGSRGFTHTAPAPRAGISDGLPPDTRASRPNT